MPHVFKEIKETMCKELKETIRTVAHKIENINKDKFLKGTKQILEVESIVTETKNAQQGLNSRTQQVRERRGEPEDESTEFIQANVQKKNTKKEK